MAEENKVCGGGKRCVAVENNVAEGNNVWRRLKYLITSWATFISEYALVHMKHNAAYQHERERYNSRREIKS